MKCLQLTSCSERELVRTGGPNFKPSRASDARSSSKSSSELVTEINCSNLREVIAGQATSGARPLTFNRARELELGNRKKFSHYSLEMVRSHLPSWAKLSIQLMQQIEQVDSDACSTFVFRLKMRQSQLAALS